MQVRSIKSCHNQIINPIQFLQMDAIQIFRYNDTPVTFEMGDGQVMVNATQMAKPFGKTTKDWLRTNSAKDFIDTLSAVRQICLTDLVKVIQGGNQQGTWMHEDAALEFARWLSPTFAIWCNDRIKELLRFGLTATPEMLARAVEDPELVLKLLSELKNGYEKGVKLQAQNDLLAEQLEEQSHKVDFYDNVHRHRTECENGRVYRVTQIAAELGIKAAELNRILKNKGIQEKKDGMWVLTDQYRNMGYTKQKGFKDHTDSDGEPHFVIFSVWTHKGREFIMRLFEEE